MSLPPADSPKAVAASARPEPEFDLIIEPGYSDRQYWKDLWGYRELLYLLSWRDILVRYKQTALGVAWAVIRPVVTMVVFTTVFGRLAKMPSEGLPYPVLVFAAMVPWQLFASALTESGGSLLTNSNLLTKVYFPRLVVPASALAGTLVEAAINTVLLFGLLIFYRTPLGWQIVTLPIFFLLSLAAAAGAGVLMAALSVRYRDFRYVVPFLIQAGLYISPVGFSSSIVPTAWRPLYQLNPLVCAIDGFRWAISAGTTHLDLTSICEGGLFTLVLLLCGLTVFRRTERSMADTL